MLRNQIYMLCGGHVNPDEVSVEPATPGIPVCTAGEPFAGQRQRQSRAFHVLASCNLRSGRIGVSRPAPERTGRLTGQ